MCGMFLKNHNVSIEEYMRMVDIHFSEFLGDKEFSENRMLNKNPVTKIYKMSISKFKADDKLEKREGLTEKLLLICAYMDSNNIPLVILNEWLHAQYPQQIKAEPTLLAKLLQQLSSYSLISFNYERDSISMSKLLQQVIQNECSLALEAKAIKILVEILFKHHPDNIRRAEDLEIFNELGPHLTAARTKIVTKLLYYKKNTNDAVESFRKTFTSKNLVKLAICDELARLPNSAIKPDIYERSIAFIKYNRGFWPDDLFEGVMSMMMENRLENPYEQDTLELSNWLKQLLIVMSNFITTFDDKFTDEQKKSFKRDFELRSEFEQVYGTIAEDTNRIFDEEKKLMNETEIKFETIRSKTSEKGHTKYIGQSKQSNVEGDIESLTRLCTFFMNTYVKTSNKNQIKHLLARYELDDDSQFNLERGLCSAASQGCVDDLKIFIDLVKNINAKDGNPKLNHTALHWAVIKEHKVCVQMLLTAGADPNVKNTAGKSPLDYASKKSSQNENCAGILEMLRENIFERTLKEFQISERILEQALNEFQFDDSQSLSPTCSPNRP